MIRYRSALLASALAVAPAVIFVVPVQAVAQGAATQQGSAAQQEGAAKQEPAPVRDIEVVVDGGYTPSRIDVSEGERVRLKFIRREYTSCTREVLIPSLNIRQELPPNKTVTVELPPLKTGEMEFRCGMNMIHGTLVVSPRKKS